MFSTCLLLSFVVTPIFGLDIYVSYNDGFDSTGAGTFVSPFKSLQYTANYISNLRSTNSSYISITINVYIASGTYKLHENNMDYTTDDTVILNLCNNKLSNINWIGDESEDVVIDGAIDLNIDDFTPHSTYSNIYYYDLRNTLNTTQIDLGNIETQNLGGCGNIRSEIIMNNKRLELARHPNILYNETAYNPLLYDWIFINESVGTNNNMFTFEVVDFDLFSEIVTRNEVNNLWLHGYWGHEWADNFVKVEWINLNNNTIKINDTTPVLYTLTDGARYYVLNVLSKLDVEDEYFIDVDNKIVYMYFDDYYNAMSNNKYQIQMSLIDYGIKLCSSVANNKFSNIKLQNFRMYGMYIDQSEHIILDSITIFHIGQNAMRFYGRNNILNNSNIYDIGCSGIYESGGDYKTLNYSNNVIENTKITFFATFKRTYRTGIHFNSVGSIFRRNVVAFAPHTGIIGSGCDNIFEYNILDTLCTETGDAGGWYSGRSWIRRGNILRYNLFRDIYRRDNSARTGWVRVQALYFDDQLSEQYVYGNTFVNNQVAIQFGGGKNLIVQNNTFIGNEQVYTLDNRGMTWQTEWCTSPNGMLWDQLRSVNYESSPWSTHYLSLSRINEGECAPIYNQMINNNWCCINDNNYSFISDQCVLSTSNWDNITLNQWNTEIYNNQYLDSTDIQCTFDGTRDYLPDYVPYNPTSAPTTPFPTASPTYPLYEWQSVLLDDIIYIDKYGVNYTMSGTQNGYLSAINVSVWSNGCGEPAAFSIFYIDGDWEKIRYRQSFYKKSSCWSILGNDQGSGFDETDNVTGLYPFSIDNDILIAHDLLFGCWNQSFETKRCDNEFCNFWHGQHGNVFHGSLKVELRRDLSIELAGIGTGTSCGTPHYVYSEIEIAYPVYPTSEPTYYPTMSPSRNLTSAPSELPTKEPLNSQTETSTTPDADSKSQLNVIFSVVFTFILILQLLS